ncbi:hypothetical protein [Aliikangiella sp. IMCC44359]|uniref:hypothetical protein n=1 Tax=Aliikangiella sp. IMCC44359 TaxID=3459125 RepID=UPI00403AF4C5
MNKKEPIKPKSVKKTKSTEALDKLTNIRELLFGEQVDELKSVIESHNQSLSQRIHELECSVKKSNKQFEKNIQKNFDELKDIIENNRLEHISQESILDETIVSVNKTLQKFQQQTESDIAEVQSDLNDSSKSLYSTLEKEIKILSQKIDQSAQELRENKADRKTLASLLESMAVNLNQN